MTTIVLARVRSATRALRRRVSTVATNGSLERLIFMRFLLAVLVLAGCGSASSDPVRDEPAPVRVPTSGTFSADAYTTHIKALRAKLDRLKLGGLTIRVEDPFVVIGNGTADQVTRSATTVRWAADRLELDFFQKRPSKILDVYLFADAATYERGVKRITGSSPTTPYGFYSSSQGALFMNIATGGGTLVHELVHPYVEADFPDAPAWLNEGLGSLFEQSSDSSGHIIGLTNWRLTGLQRTISDGDTLPTFKELTHLDDNAFYGAGSGTHYAMARYLMYYLQEKGLLVDFYKKFRAGRAKDPSGYATLVAVLGEKDMAAFQKRWVRFVSALEFG